MLKCFLALLILGMLSPTVFAQDVTYPANREVITVANVDQLEPLARIGNGVLRPSLSYSPDGKTLAVAGSLGIWLYQADDLSQPPTLIDLDSNVSQVAFSPDGRYLGYTNRGYVHVMDFERREEVFTLDDTSIFAFHPDSNSIAVEAFDYNQPDGYKSWNIHVWNFKEQTLITTYKGTHIPNSYYSFLTEINFTPDGRKLFGAISGDDFNSCGLHETAIAEWGINQDSEEQPTIIPDSDDFTITSDSTDLITFQQEFNFGHHGNLTLWDIEKRVERSILKRETRDSFWESGVDLDLSLNGEWVIAAFSSSLRLWSVETGILNQVFEYDRNLNPQILALAFSPDS